CTRPLTEDEIRIDYEKNTGKVIVEEFQRRDLDPQALPGVVITGHAPFCWGKSAVDAVHNALVLEEVATMALATRALNPAIHITQE
ncbi:class II aldolase/adducin family protein, partial [Escherichia coli]|nr:class II aldolase/adducin family protein [Escherichia coli]